MNDVQAWVNRILPFSCVDGPGNRFVIFLQGCNYNCWNCHNPQTIGNCDYCDLCRKECPVEALSLKTDEEGWQCNLDLCLNCDLCLQVCPQDSTPHSFNLTVEEAIKQIRKAEPFLEGITLSGGEATLQAEFVRELFTRIKQDPDLSRLTRFLDSNGSADQATWLSLLPVMDGAMIDLKAFDPARHLELTGQDNQAVLESLVLLNKQKKLHEIRLLIIPEITDSPTMLQETALWIHRLNPELPVKLMGFRRHGVREEYSFLKACPQETLGGFHQLFQDVGLKNVIML